jgi:hypothetical protein
VVEWETVREIALALPEAEDASGERPAFRVRGKLFAWKSRQRDGGALAVRVDPDEKHLILASNPDVYFETPHYQGYPAVLIRLENIEHDDLVERIEDAWLTRVPKRVAAQYLGASRDATAGETRGRREPR